MKSIAVAVTLAGLLINPLLAADRSEVVSFKCALAIDAALAEIDRQANNPVTRQAMSQVDESSGQFACIPADGGTLFVRLQSSTQTAGENRLVFTVDRNSYRVLKTHFGP